MKKALLIFILGCTLAPALSAQSANFWAEAQAPALPGALPVIKPEAARILHIDMERLKQQLAQAPLESSTVNAANSAFQIVLPTPDGQAETFQLVASPIMAKGLSRQFPGMRTFIGKSTENDRAMARIDYTHKGFHAMVLKGEDTYFIDPYYHDRAHPVHQVYYKRDYKADKPFACEWEESLAEASPAAPAAAAQVGQELRTYRIAVAATGEYTQYHGGTVEDAMAAIVTSMNRVNGVYENDISARMILVDSNHLIIYTDPGSDPYSGSSGNHLGQNQGNLDQVLGNDGYDIGHVFHRAGGGGVAFLRSLCSTNNKARGFTSQSDPVGDPFDIDYVAHEIGHQFGGNHTQNNTCNRAADSAMEPGSASTIMGYAGICAPNLQNNSDPYFHAISQEEMIGHTVFGDGDNCAVRIPTGNTPPEVEAGESGRFLPISTPFELAGQAFDLEGDSLTYCWEQFDLGPSAPPDAPSGNSPIFRSFLPTTDSVRVFPRLSDLVNNTTTIGEYLPDYARGLRFRLTVRDNHGFGGGVGFDDLSFIVTEQAGPFRVLSQNQPLPWAAGSLQLVSWDVANTHQPPVAAERVDISLSTDGGFTYPYTLAAEVPNNGLALITVPDSLDSPSCRIKVKASGHVFFDINDANFAITASTSPSLALGALAPVQEACAGQSVEFPILGVPLGGFDETVTFSLAGLPPGFEASGLDTTSLPTSFSLQLFAGSGLPSGLYPFQLIASGGGISDTLDLALRYFAQIPAPPLLLSPAEGELDVSVTPTLSWTADANAQAYDLELALDPAFQDIVYAQSGITDTFVVLSNAIPDSSIFFWRLRGRNAPCGPGIYSFGAFETEIIRCEIFRPEDLPLDLSEGGGIVNSLISVDIDQPIRKVRILNVRGAFSPLSGLRFRFRGPHASLINLFTESCDEGFFFDFSLDDEAGQDLDCPPTGGQFFRPESALSIYNGLSTAGDWRLILFKNGESGTLSNWELELCYPQPRISATRSAQAAAAALEVFPNPSSGSFALRLPTGLAPGARLQAYAASGQLVQQWSVEGSEQLELPFSIAGQPAGLYALQLRDAQGVLIGVAKLLLGR